MLDTSLFFEEGLGVFSGILAVYAIVFGFAAIIGITLFILQGIGLFNISKKLNLSCPWISFIPVVSFFSLGKIAERYIKNDGRKSAKFSILLLCFAILSYLLLFAFFAVLIIGIIGFLRLVNTNIADDTMLTSEIFSVLIPSVVIYLLAFAVSVTYSVLYYIALWRIFAMLNYANATLYLVLSIFFGFLAPIFIFVIRNKEPKFTYGERMGFEPILEFEEATNNEK